MGPFVKCDNPSFDKKIALEIRVKIQKRLDVSAKTSDQNLKVRTVKEKAWWNCQLALCRIGKGKSGRYSLKIRNRKLPCHDGAILCCQMCRATTLTSRRCMRDRSAQAGLPARCRRPAAFARRLGSNSLQISCSPLCSSRSQSRQVWPPQSFLHLSKTRKWLQDSLTKLSW